MCQDEKPKGSCFSLLNGNQRPEKKQVGCNKTKEGTFSRPEKSRLGVIRPRKALSHTSTLAQ